MVKFVLLIVSIANVGFNKKPQTKSGFPEKTHVRDVLIDKLVSMRAGGILPDVITFAGNGRAYITSRFFVDYTRDYSNTRYLCS